MRFFDEWDKVQIEGTFFIDPAVGVRSLTLRSPRLPEVL